MPWWNLELDKLKRDVSRLKRRIANAAQIGREWVVGQYVAAKEKYQMEVKRAQTTSWKEFCGRQERNNVGQYIQGDRQDCN